MAVVLACCVLHNHIMRVDPNDPIMGDTTREIDSQHIVHQTDEKLKKKVENGMTSGMR